MTFSAIRKVSQLFPDFLICQCELGLCHVKLRANPTPPPLFQSCKPIAILGIYYKKVSGQYQVPRLSKPSLFVNP
jgi:hypothetical protein